MADTTNNPCAERTADTAETPQLVVAVTTLFGDEECAPPAKKSRTLFAHSSPERSCGVMGGRGPLYPSMDTDETPQLAVALTHDLYDEEFLCAMGWRKLERAEHTAETPQVVVASTPHLVGGNCASDAAGVTATSPMARTALPLRWGNVPWSRSRPLGGLADQWRGAPLSQGPPP